MECPFPLEHLQLVVIQYYQCSVPISKHLRFFSVYFISRVKPMVTTRIEHERIPRILLKSLVESLPVFNPSAITAIVTSRLE
jgi:hypothetical protein